MEQNTRNRSSFSNEGSYDQDRNRYDQGGYGNRGYSSDYDNDWNRNRNYGNTGRSSYGQDYGSGNDRDFDRWNDANYANYGNRGNSYGRSGSYSDWDFQGQGNRSRDFDTFSNDYYDRDRSRSNYGQMYGGGFESERSRYGQSSGYRPMYGGNYDYDRSGYGHDTQNMRHGNYENRYGSQDYGRFNRSQDYGRNRDWDSDYRDRNDRSWWDRTKDEVASWFGDDDAERRRRMDERRDREYSMRGKGPRNYNRSSERIKEDVSDRLSDAWDIDASDIDVDVSGSEITLNGTVPSKQQKRRAEDIAESVSGVTHVQNNLRVKQHEYNRNDWNSGGTSGSSSSSLSGTSAGTTGTGTTIGSAATSGSTTGTSSSGNTPSNQVKIEKSSAS